MNRYAPAGNFIVAESFPDEIVVVNLLTGLYYSLDGTARDLWEHLVAGRTVDQIVDHMNHQYQAAPADLRRVVDDFARSLQDETLLISTAEPLEPPAAELRQDRPPFVAPALHRYTDMEQLLLLDPIHDVDVTGWPVPAKPTDR